MTTAHAVVNLRLTINRAAATARDGDLDHAAQLLDGLDDHAAADVTVLDLRARIHAQNGDLAAADRCWARVLNTAPDHAPARTGRALISRITQGRKSIRPRVQPRPAIAAVTVAIVAAAGAWVLTADGPTQTRAVSAALAPAPDLAPGSRTDHDLDTIIAATTLAGVTPHRRGGDVEAILDAGAFESDTAITTTAANLLTEIGSRTAALPVSITVTGHTVAVAGGPQTGGSTVAWERAAVAATYLAQGSGRPLTAFTLTSADQRDAPHPDPARNRTVTVLLRPTP
ncbi:tetratricopeptide repeat protein [Nocardia thraciensis]